MLFARAPDSPEGDGDHWCIPSPWSCCLPIETKVLVAPAGETKDRFGGANRYFGDVDPK